ncbi:MAG: hypothetical protein QM737_21495 [Ferruginibacter sp.]
MKNNILLFSFFIMLNILFSCSRKTTPNNTKNSSKTEKETVVTKKDIKVKTPAPTVIVVNDSAAKKTVDGRYYYDLNGKRYWRNNRDGKYYLFNKSMYNNPDFKPQP